MQMSKPYFVFFAECSRTDLTSMSYFTESLSSQLQMMGLENKAEDHSNINLLTSGFSNVLINQQDHIAHPHVQPTTDHGSQLVKDVATLRGMLETRMRYTRPQVGGKWEFNLYTTDVRYLQDCIEFIDNNCENRFYNEYLSPLEMDAEELDDEFGIRFYNHFSFKVVRQDMIEHVRLSKYDYLSNLIMFRRSKGDSVPKSWFIFPENKRLTESDYIRFYDVMDDTMKEWILQYCVNNNYIRERAETLKMTTYDVLDVVSNGQNVSFQLKLLVDLLNRCDGHEEYLQKGFLPYLTYVEHLQTAIEKSIPKCQNPYKIAFMLMVILKGMSVYPDLLNAFEPKLEEFLFTYPNFTLGDLSKFLQKYDMPHLKELDVKKLMN